MAKLPYRTDYSMQMLSDTERSKGYEVGDFDESMTVPGQAKTIKQIMERALGGLMPDGRLVEYFDQEDLDKINKYYANPGSLDLTDLDEMAEHVEALQDVVKKGQKIQEEKLKEEERERIREEVRQTEADKEPPKQETNKEE